MSVQLIQYECKRGTGSRTKSRQSFNPTSKPVPYDTHTHTHTHTLTAVVTLHTLITRSKISAAHLWCIYKESRFILWYSNLEHEAWLLSEHLKTAQKGKCRVKSVVMYTPFNWVPSYTRFFLRLRGKDPSAASKLLHMQLCSYSFELSAL